MKKYKTLIIFTLLFIFTFFVNFYAVSNNDLIWNYGFCYNVAKGLKMYKDFNMVITPLFPTIFGLLMKLFGNNTIIFFLFNTLVPLTIYYIVYKYYKKVFIETIILITFISIPNYNLLCMMFLFLLFILEDKNKNDYLIGIVLGLIFLTKSPMGILTLASLYYIKDIKKIIKRFIGFMIPNIIYIIYFYINNTLLDYINYAFGSLFDFATKNVRSGVGIIIFVASIILIIYLYKKKKDIKLIYILLFQIMSYPIFNGVHLLYSAIPLIFYILLNIDNKLYIKYKKYLAIVLICPIMATILQNVFINMEYGTNALKYKRVESKYLEDSKILKEHINNFNNTYFIMYEAYYNKLLLNLNINKYDVMLSGNLGYNGEEETIKYFDKLSVGTKFILYKNYEGGQAPKKIYDHITKNYRFKDSFDKYVVYVK